MRDNAINNMNKNLEADFNDIVFTKASRLFEKYQLDDEQADIAADTFVDIMAQAGIRDLGDDLIAKVELAVARARMIKPKVEKIADEVKEVAKDIKEAIEDVAEAKAEKPEEKAEAEVHAEEEEKKEEPEVVVVEEKPALDEYKEGASDGKPAASASINEDNVLDKLASLPFRERVQFMKENYDLINRAAAKASKNNKAK